MSPVAAYVLQTLLTLIGIVVVAAGLLYIARRAGVGQPSGPLRLLGRLPLDARRVVYLVQAGARVYVVAGSEAGLEKLGELEASDFPIDGEPAPATFAEALSRVTGHKGSGTPAATPPPQTGRKPASGSEP